MGPGLRHIAVSFAICPVLFVTTTAAAQNNPTSPDPIPNIPIITPVKGTFLDASVVKTKAEVDKRPNGWDATLSVGASVNFVNNSNVVGQVEGSTWTLGANLKGGLDYIGGNHAFRTTWNINQTFTNTPTVPIFVPTADEIKLETVYYYAIPKVKCSGGSHAPRRAPRCSLVSTLAPAHRTRSPGCRPPTSTRTKTLILLRPGSTPTPSRTARERSSGRCFGYATRCDLSS